MALQHLFTPRAPLSLYRFAEHLAPASPLPRWWGHAFGWVGARDKHLSKYADVLAAAGCASTSRATVPTADAFFLPHRLGAHADAFLDVANTRFAARPCALLLLSNGGAFVAAEVAARLATPAGRARWPRAVLGAAIFDSAPAAITPRSAALALSSSLAPRARAAAYAAARAAFGAAYAVARGPRGAGRGAALFAALEADASAAPQLFIYSDADEISDAGALAAHVAARRARHPRGAGAVSEWRIRGRASAHCAHLAAAREEYAARVAAFLADAERARAAAA